MEQNGIHPRVWLGGLAKKLPSGFNTMSSVYFARAQGRLVSLT